MTFTRCFALPIAALAGLCCLWLSSATAANLVDNVQYLLRAAVTAPVDPVPADRLNAYDQPLRRFYADRDYLPAWINEQGMTPLAGSMFDLLRHAGDEGLDPADYHLAEIEAIAVEYDRMRQHGWMLHPELLADLDLLLTRGFMLYAADQISGRLDPATLHEGWETRPRPADPVSLLLKGLADPASFGPILAELPPPHPGYKRLRDAFWACRQLAQQGSWPTLADGPTIHPGSFDARLPVIRHILSRWGDLTGLTEEPDYYDQTTRAAMQRFQARHGLTADGVIGRDTLEALRVSPAQRAQQLKLNMERWRWLPKDLGERYLMVNIAGYALDVVEADRTVLQMAVVVGKDYRKTPVFSDRVRHLEFAPCWNVPPTILKEDLLPVIRKEPALWFQTHPDFAIVSWDGSGDVPIRPESIDWLQVTEKNFPGSLRQRPGKDNPLGQVKFMFPNKYQVYLHDTSARGIFSRETRALSSGCIRVAKPVDLALYLLAGMPEWDVERVREAMGGEAPQVVRLARSTPVHILYWTAWVDADGTLQFRRDIYDRDQTLQQALARLPRPVLGQVQPAAGRF